MDISTIYNYQFKNLDFLNQAFTHPSFISGEERQSLKSYERLEFLGDAVLGLIITELLVKLYPEEKEGDLAKRRAGLVSGEVLTSIAMQLNLGDFLIMTPGEELSGGRSNHRNLENTLEAFIGALYIDGGLEHAQKFIQQYFLPKIKQMKLPPTDPKTMLQEWAQSLGKAVPEYVVVAATGPAHLPKFTVEVRVEGFPVVQAEAGSKKEAERVAALKLLQKKGVL